ncbi:hypothetical protein R0G64_31600, partial [Pseudomonas otitidis]
RAMSRQSQFHTMALVNLSAKMIESCYFLRRFEGEWLLSSRLMAPWFTARMRPSPSKAISPSLNRPTYSACR